MKIGVIANCQAQGLAQCVEAMIPSAAVEVFGLQHMPTLSQPGHGAWVERVHECDILISQPVVGDYGALTISELRGAHPGLIVVPNVVFGGFQPDCCYLHKDMKAVETPTHHYNSAVIAGAYLAEIAPDRVASLFNKFVYRGLGYPEEFDVQAGELRAVFSHYGYDADPVFAARAVFMHTPNHPCIDVLFDLARQALVKAGVPHDASAQRPPDRLAMYSTRWPVYPELARRIGQEDGLRFFHGSNEYSLEQMIAPSYQAYAEIQLEVGQFHGPEVRRAMQFLAQHALRRPADAYSQFGHSSSHAESEPYVLGESIDFGQGWGANRYLLDGWSGPEPGFTWTESHEASFSMRLLASALPVSTPKGYKLELDFFPMTYPGSDRLSQRLELLVNGHALHTGDYVDETSVCVSVPSAFIRLHEPIVITLRAPEATRPIDVNPNNPDTRLLGFAVRRAAFHVAR